MQPLTFDTPLKGSISTDEPDSTSGQKGMIFVPVDSDQATQIISNRRAQTC